MENIALNLCSNNFVLLMCECRKAKNSREDNVDVVDKLMTFFAEMKGANDEFY